MAYESANLDATFAAAAGSDPELMRELRIAFFESVERQANLLGRARCDGNWETAAQRMRSLAASFHADDLLILAEEALECAPGEPYIIRKIERYCQEMIRD